MQLRIAGVTFATYQRRILRQPRSNFVCKPEQFFRKSCVKLLSMAQQKGRKTCALWLLSAQCRIRGECKLCD
jgi:hypothetical protein